MTQPTPLLPRLSELPLWRLIIALDDSERISGPSAPATKALVRQLRERLRSRRASGADESPAGEGVRHVP
jgi:hypothetical protein